MDPDFEIRSRHIYIPRLFVGGFLIGSVGALADVVVLAVLGMALIMAAFVWILAIWPKDPHR